MNCKAKLAVSLWVVMRFSHHPLAVELIVAVDAEAIIKVSEHRFPPRFDTFNAAPGQLLLERFEMIEGKENFCGGIGAEGAFYFIGGDADFWAFGHGEGK